MEFRYLKNGKGIVWDENNRVGEFIVYDMDRPCAYLEHLIIYKKFRRRGYATNVLQSLIKTHGTALSLYCKVDNEIEIKTYLANGFFISLYTKRKNDEFYLMTHKISPLKKLFKKHIPL